jgi:hypothetical protein
MKSSNNDSRLIGESYALARESSVILGGAFASIAKQVNDNNIDTIGPLAKVLHDTHKTLGNEVDFSVIPDALRHGRIITSPEAKNALGDIHSMMGYVAQDQGGPRAFNLEDWPKLNAIISRMADSHPEGRSSEEPDRGDELPEMAPFAPKDPNI